MRVDARHCAESTPTLALLDAEKLCGRPPRRVCATIEESVGAENPRKFALLPVLISHRSEDHMQCRLSTGIVTNPALCRPVFSLVAADEKWPDLGAIHHSYKARSHQRHFGSPQTTPWCYRAAVDTPQVYSLWILVTL